MKKIMLKDKYGLTQAVLDGRKTQTRRIVNEKQIKHALFVQKEYGISLEEAILKYTTPYLVWEEIAIAQSYKDANYTKPYGPEKLSNLINTPGWNNKLFAKAELMPHHIRITDIRVERLQDIIGDDCLREGIEQSKQGGGYYFQENGKIKSTFGLPWFAFADLINKVCGRGTWQRNPYVFVYDFKLVD